MNIEHSASLVCIQLTQCLVAPICYAQCRNEFLFEANLLKISASIWQLLPFRRIMVTASKQPIMPCVNAY